MIQNLFEQVWRMAAGATGLMVCVLLVRPFLKGFPRNLTCLLWALVALRLLLPFSIQVSLPAVPLGEWKAAGEMGRFLTDIQWWEAAGKSGLEKESEQPTVSADGGIQQTGQQADRKGTEMTGQRELLWNTGRETGRSNAAIAAAAENGGTEEGRFWHAAAFIWAAGAAAVLLYCFIMNLCLKRRVREAVSVGKRTAKVRVMECERIETAFVLGLLKPAVYLPASLRNPDRRYVLIHEKTHLRRRDHIWKWMACLFLAVYWFHPLVWICAFTFFKDVEEACDETVLEKIGEKGKLPYAEALFHAAQGRKSGWAAAPGFGEGNVKKRVKRVLEYRKKAAAGIVITAAVMLAACSPFFLENREKAAADAAQTGEAAGGLPENDAAADEKTEVPEAAPTDETAGGSYKTQDGYDAKYAAEHVWTVEPVTEEELTDSLMAADPYRVILRKNVGGLEDVDVIYTEPVAYDGVSDTYGIRVHPATQEKRLHSGVDLAAEAGTAVYAAAEGTVVETGYDDTCGNYVIVRHPNGELTYYANCEQILAQEGDGVDAKTQIAAVGSTGRSTGPHLHFALSRDGVYVDPFKNRDGFGENSQAQGTYRDSLTKEEL